MDRILFGQSDNEQKALETTKPSKPIKTGNEQPIKQSNNSNIIYLDNGIIGVIDK